MWTFLIGAIFLPYVAVVMANAGPGRDTDPALRQVGGVGRELPPTAPEPPDRPRHRAPGRAGFRPGLTVQSLLHRARMTGVGSVSPV